MKIMDILVLLGLAVYGYVVVKSVDAIRDLIGKEKPKKYTHKNQIE